jgi:hypothetical protein
MVRALPCRCTQSSGGNRRGSAVRQHCSSAGLRCCEACAILARSTSKDARHGIVPDRSGRPCRVYSDTKITLTIKLFTEFHSTIAQVVGRIERRRFRMKMALKLSSVAQTGTERVDLPDRPRHADGRAFPAVLDASTAGRGTTRQRLPTGTGQASGRAAGGVPGQRWLLRPYRRVLRPPWGVVVVRPQREVRPPLPLPRLEIRLYRSMHRSTFGAGRKRLCQEDQA